MYTKTYQPRDVFKALEVYNNVKSFRKASEFTGIGKSTIHRWWVSFRGVVKRKTKQHPRKAKRYNTLKSDLLALFSNTKLSFLSLKQIRSSLKLDKKPCLSWIHKSLRNLRISRRRFTNTKVCGRSSDSMKHLYEQFSISLNALKDHEIVCLDETAFCNIGNPTYGYFPKGKVPEQHSVPRRQRISLLMAIHSKGVISWKEQPKAFDKQSFLSYLKECLLPKLPSNVKAILMDNIAFHKSKDIIELLKNHSLQCLFIPPYSPRCNPIEEVFSWLKRSFRAIDPNIGSFQERVNQSLEGLKLYKDLTPYYKHTRDHVQQVCHISEQ